MARILRPPEAAVFLKSLTLSNILSFGPEPHTVELGPLNVIIGPNGSGKSNFIEAIGLLKAAPRDIREPIREGGGVDEWIWKGPHQQGDAIISIVTDAIFELFDIEYHLNFRSSFNRFSIKKEKINASGDYGRVYVVVNDGKLVSEENDKEVTQREIKFDSDRSVLSQIRHPFDDFEVEYLSQSLEDVAIFREFAIDRSSAVRRPQKADLPNNFLTPDASNLGLIINYIRRTPESRRALQFTVREIYEGVEDVDVQIGGGDIQLFLFEKNAAISANRLSSGTLRFLCLVAILCHPNPPPLICIEEPELGLHPDLIPTISRLLKEASERTQIIVTTHSDILVDTMTDRPEAVLVAEKGEGGTRLTRLDPEQLKPWLEKYRLGDLWTRGDVGGTRW